MLNQEQSNTLLDQDIQPQHNLSDNLALNAIKKDQTEAIFLDMAKAFDRVWHQGLLHKLWSSGTPTYLVRLVQSFLADWIFQIKVLDELSNPREIEEGVPQGSCLSPLLYIEFINDLPTIPKIKIALIAEDNVF